MYTVIRNYTGSPGLADTLKPHRQAIEKEISTIAGFIAYYLIKTADGMTSVTVCETRAGCDESTQRAAAWIKQNLPTLRIPPPEVINGELAFKFANYKSTSV